MKINNQLKYLFLYFVVFLMQSCKNDTKMKDSTLNMEITNQTKQAQVSKTKMYVTNEGLLSKDFAYLSKYEPKDGFVPTAEIASMIADAVLSNIYGKTNIDEQKPFSINLDNGIWIIDGYIEPGIKGGSAYMEISQETGEILKVSHGK